MSASLPQRNDIFLFGLPCGKRDIRSSEAGKEHMRAVAAPQGRSAKVVGNDKVSVNILDFGRALDKYGSVQISPHSHTPPSCSNTEQLPIGAYLRAADNRLNELTKFLFDQRLSWPDAANDNELPRESEAA